ncbi:hypothetical protein CHS0354_030428 [Potamilus streckersoni]|uniref:Sulfotransferase domain-containing protein n=1 Tax=Potamilus streckersoni TaxID=2493646 RepID=A0AAE0S8D1_9BIVA|nr:hypothetical protein CHS0354_030428 [Potamilus streckersoni]
MILRRGNIHKMYFAFLLLAWMFLFRQYLLGWNISGDPILLQSTPENHVELKNQIETILTDGLFETTEREKIEDIIDLSDQLLMSKGPFEFLWNFKNPCFLSDESGIRCLPYFHIIGGEKCGTTDLFYRLKLHPEISWEHEKSINYFHLKRFATGINHWTFERYLGQFSESAQVIGTTFSMEHCSESVKKCAYHPIITGDGSAQMLGDKQYKFFSNNITQKEPNLTNADILFHLNPKTKFIIILRNPIERAYSDYYFNSWYRGLFTASLEHFHTTMAEQISNFTTCCQTASIISCAYKHGDVPYKERILRHGIYYIFVKDWLRVFPREQILILRFEDMTKNKRQIYRQIQTFLGIRQLSTAEEDRVMSQPIMNQRPLKLRLIGDMYPKTRVLLEKFYAPHNAELARFLKDSRFLWH